MPPSRATSGTRTAAGRNCRGTLASLTGATRRGAENNARMLPGRTTVNRRQMRNPGSSISLFEGKHRALPRDLHAVQGTHAEKRKRQIAFVDCRLDATKHEFTSLSSSIRTSQTLADPFAVWVLTCRPDL